jgi:spermidine synthase
MRRGAFLVLFALSGAAALVYEVVWTRLLTLQIGHGVAAASTVLAAFMGGLAAGAAVGGRFGQRQTPSGALRAYAKLEVAIAGAAVLLPLVLSALEPLLRVVYADGNGGWAFPALRLVTSLFLLALPAAAMGATFPIASRWMVRSAASMSGDAGRLYAVNTLGAAAGAVAAGFLLLPTFGLMGATLAGVVLNLVAAGGAWYISSGTAPADADLPAERQPDAKAGATRRRGGARTTTSKAAARAPSPQGKPWLAAAALGMTGLASLSLQVVWTRLLASILGPTTYAFSAVVAVFILGIAGGAALGAWLSRRIARPMTPLSLVVMASGALALAAALGVDATLLAIGRLVATPGITFEAVLARQLIAAAGLLLPMAIAFGAAFPLAVAVASRGDDTAVSDLGLVYAVNTIGAITGALLTGFALVPALGLHDTIRVVGALTAIAGAVLVVWSGGGGWRQWAPLTLAVVVLAAAWNLPSWDPRLLSSGAYKYAPALRGPDLETSLTAGELVYYREGSTATVAVRELAGTTALSIDGKVDASDAGDMLTQRLLAHVPLLLHPNPRSAAILGLGSGVTLGSALTHGLERATVLEISPEVVEASRFFDDQNHRALADPRTRLIVGDGRTHLLLSDERYDVIVSEPSNPWMAGIASLFTREFFELARTRLNEGGILCQWAHTYDISDGDLRSIVATFLSVFPDGTLWLVGDADVLLIGSTAPLTDRLGGMAQAWKRPGVAEDLAGVGVQDPFALLSLYVADGDGLADWSAGARIQTDDRGRLEFSGPRSVFGGQRTDNAKILRDLAAGRPRPPAVQHALDSATSDQWTRFGEMLRRADSHRAAYEAFLKALDGNPRDPVALDGLVNASAPLGRAAEARTYLSGLAADPANQEAKLALSRLLASQGTFEESARIPLGLLQGNPGNVAALEQLASILTDAGDTERLEPVVARLKMVAPSSASTHYYAAALGFLQGRMDVAIREAETALAADPSHARARNILGAALAGVGQRDRARAAFTQSLQADPRDAATYSNLATLELEVGNAAAARRYFAEALTIDPDNRIAREGLASILDR